MAKSGDPGQQEETRASNLFFTRNGLIEDDELTAQERAGILKAIASLERGEGIPWEQVREDLRRVLAN